MDILIIPQIKQSIIIKGRYNLPNFFFVAAPIIKSRKILKMIIGDKNVSI